MAYNSYNNLKKVIDKFNLKVENQDLFQESDIKRIEPSEWLKTSIEKAEKLGFGSEKERSERLISPILTELAQINNHQITIYSGRKLDIDKDFSGEIDYLIALGHKVVDFFDAPLFSVAEAKNEDMTSGIAKCTVQMMGAIQYNKLDGIELPYIYGVATEGEKWRFLKFENKTLTIHQPYYYLSNLPLLLGVFSHLIDDCRTFKI